ncbi:MAG: hypothetical protein PHU41_05425 [Sulfuricurvum sp.]|nr:hypothetical protein [Sulfuricurvum sp.]
MQVNSYTFQTPYSQPLQIGRPDPSMVKDQNEKIQEQSIQQGQNTTELLGVKSKDDQAKIHIKSSAIYQNDQSYNSTTLFVKEYMSFSKEAQRSTNINAYVNNSSDFLARANP